LPAKRQNHFIASNGALASGPPFARLPVNVWENIHYSSTFWPRTGLQFDDLKEYVSETHHSPSIVNPSAPGRAKSPLLLLLMG
jgi:hypothetical protein